MAHEFGHLLGMWHDFIRHDNSDNTCRPEGLSDEDDEVGIPCDQCTNWNGNKLEAQTNKTGECCTGFLDYGDHPEYWSDCSVRMFEARYLKKNWETCMPKGINIVEKGSYRVL